MRVRGSGYAVCALPAGFVLESAGIDYDPETNIGFVSWNVTGPDPLGFEVVVSCDSGPWESGTLAGDARSWSTPDMGGGQSGTVTVYALDSCGQRATSRTNGF